MVYTRSFRCTSHKRRSSTVFSPPEVVQFDSTADRWPASGCLNLLLLPVFRRPGAPHDLARLVAPLALDLDERGVFPALRSDARGIALLLHQIFREDQFCSGTLAVYDDERVADRDVEGIRLLYRGVCPSALIGFGDPLLPLEMVGPEDQFRVVGIEVCKTLTIGLTEIVVITCDQVLDRGALDERLRCQVLGPCGRNSHQRQAP